VDVVAPRLHPADPSFEQIEALRIYRFRYLSEGKLLKEYRSTPPAVVGSYFFAGLYRALRVIRRGQCDIVYAHWALPMGLIGAAAGMATGKKLLVHVHGSDINVVAEKGGLYRLLTRFVLRRAEAIIASSEPLKELLVRRHGVEPRKVWTIPCGIDQQLFRPASRSRARALLGIPASKTVVLYVGDLLEAKGLTYLLKAAERLSGRNGKLLFALIGEGSLKEKLRREVVAKGLQNVICLVGSVANRQVPHWLNAADLFLYPSLCEGSPVSIMEALSCGTPVVATKTGGIPDMIEEGENGMLIEPASAGAIEETLRYLLANPHVLEGMRGALRARRPDFSLSRRAGEVLRILRMVADQD
jgi:glycosyltransferase involved in cell wall biosynthesis